MSELQVALALIGGIAVIGIVIYNRLQERKFRQRTGAGLTPPARDALLDTEPVRKEPSHRVDPDFYEPAIKEALPRGIQGRGDTEPHFGDTEILLEAALSEDSYKVPSAAGIVEDSAQLTRKEPSEAAPFDESIEFHAILKNREGMAAGKFGDAINRSASFEKRVRWLGLSPGGLSWEEVSPLHDKNYLEVQSVMQMADRNGPARQEDLAALCELIGELAEANGWQVRCDDADEGAVRAQSLDKFCADVDVQIGLNIVARGSSCLPIARIRHEAESAGMRLGSNGVYQLLDSRGETLFMMGNREPRPFSHENAHEPETKGITLLFDVPRVPDGLKNFETMVKLGRKLAHDAGGLLVDDNLRPLTDVGIEKIRAQLGQIYDRMEARGLPAGSRLALRLFS